MKYPRTPRKLWLTKTVCKKNIALMKNLYGKGMSIYKISLKIGHCRDTVMKYVEPEKWQVIRNSRAVWQPSQEARLRNSKNSYQRKKKIVGDKILKYSKFRRKLKKELK